MKKLLLALIIIVYGFSSSGATVQVHYCCGKLKDISWNTDKEDDCGMQHKMASKPCCEVKSISTKDEDECHEYFSLLPVTKTPVEPLTFYISVSPPAITSLIGHNKPIHPTLTLQKSLCILNCVFRI